ncbi:MAG: hypothetical protein NC311_02145 [Muribaculaceae bacterium]|nr:hypothetical protein [Muribaculaceae bacterium]
MYTLVISGFPGIGKTYACQQLKRSLKNVFDSDSSDFSWDRHQNGEIKLGADGKKLRHPDFPNNYIKHIQTHLETADIIFVSSHDNVRNALSKAQISHALVYPAYEMKAEMLQRYMLRGSGQGFIELIRNNWDAFINGMKQDACPNKIELKPGQYLSDVLVDVIRMMGKCK